MERAPDEVLDHIIDYLDDAALLTLSRASRQWRARLSCRQTLWARRFEQQFSQRDDNEREWLRQYKHVHAARVHANGVASRLPSLCSNSPFEWFDTYRERCAIEYRWRCGLHMEHQLVGAADARPDGIRIQSIPYALYRLDPENALIASQWLLKSQQRLVWILERPCWDGVDTSRMEITREWHSAEYLVIWTMDRKMFNRRSLYAWHLDALDAPPRTIMADKPMIGTDIYKNWVIYGYMLSMESNQYSIVVAHLTKELHYSDTLGSFNNCCIQRATADDVCIIWVEFEFGPSGSTMVTYKLWQFTSSRTTPFQCQAVGTTAMNRTTIGEIMPKRVDDSRFIMFSNNCGYLGSASSPTLVLVEVIGGAEGVLLKEKWSRSLKTQKIRPIVSRDMLGVLQDSGKWSLLSLKDGCNLHRLHLDCWHNSGLYSSDDQW
ncbi:hypothetical protein THASP1DRAFT_30784, partial [Thamnocephalis sphaerospora]